MRRTFSRVSIMSSSRVAGVSCAGLALPDCVEYTRVETVSGVGAGLNGIAYFGSRDHVGRIGAGSGDGVRHGIGVKQRGWYRLAGFGETIGHAIGCFANYGGDA